MGFKLVNLFAPQLDLLNPLRGMGKAEQVSEPASNRLLDQHSRELYAISREQFGQLRDQHRNNLKAMGHQRTGELTAKAAARQTGGAGPATKAYSPNVTGTGGLGVGTAMNSVANQQKNRTAAGSLSLVSDAARLSGQGLGSLSALSGMQYDQEMNRANRSRSNANGLGKFIGQGIGYYGNSNSKATKPLGWTDNDGYGIG